MTYRNRLVERCAHTFLKTLSPHILKFPFDISAAASTLPNCVVHSYQTIAFRRNLHVNDVIAICDSETGCTHKLKNNYIIMYNNSALIKQERKMFTLAHEIGHICLKHFNVYEDTYIAENSIINKKIEREANYFAACVLCPTPIIYKVQPKTIYDIQKIFGVSQEAAEIAWKDYKNYNRSHHISWHNDMIKLFSF